MKSVVELEINAPQSKVASLFMDPNNNPKWMDEIDRIEAVSGTPGDPGSVYRMVPKRDDLEFVATVVAKDPPVELRLSLVGHNTSVSVIARLRKAAEGRTTLISEETFQFEGLFGRAIGLMARFPIKRAHRRHMESFKRFAERQG